MRVNDSESSEHILWISNSEVHWKLYFQTKNINFTQCLNNNLIYYLSISLLVSELKSAPICKTPIQVVTQIIFDVLKKIMKNLLKHILST